MAAPKEQKPDLIISSDPDSHDWDHPIQTKNIIQLAKERIGIDSAGTVYKRYAHLAQGLTTESNLNRRHASLRGIQRLHAIQDAMQAQGWSENIQDEVLNIIGEPLNTSPMFVKVLATLIFADMVVSAPDEGQLSQFQQVVSVVHESTGYASNILTGIFVARCQYRSNQPTLHTTFMALYNNKPLTETVATNIVAMTAIADVFKEYIATDHLKLRLPQIKLFIGSDTPQEVIPTDRERGYPYTIMRLDTTSLPSSDKLDEAVRFGKPDRKSGILRHQLPQPGFGIVVDTEHTGGDLVKDRYFVYLEIPMLSWQNDVDAAKNPDFIPFDGLSLFLATRISRAAKVNLDRLENEGKEENEQFGIQETDPLKYHEVLEAKKLRSLMRTARTYLKKATAIKATRLIQTRQGEVAVGYSWVTQALEQEYGLHFISRLVENNQLEAVEKQVGSYLLEQVIKLISREVPITYRYDLVTAEELEEPIQLKSLILLSGQEINQIYRRHLLNNLIYYDKVAFAITLLTDSRNDTTALMDSLSPEELPQLQTLISNFKKNAAWQDLIDTLPKPLIRKLSHYFDTHSHLLIIRWETIMDTFWTEKNSPSTND
jgi:hypothetical protein